MPQDISTRILHADRLGRAEHGATLKPLHISQPDGPSFTIDGHELSWQGWRVHVALHPIDGLVLDMFQFTDGERFLALNPDAKATLLQAIEDVVAGRANVADRLRRRQLGVARRRAADVTPVVYTDNASSERYTIVEIVAADELGLLHRIGAAMSACQCEIDLVLIATEGARAIDVFHITKGGEKLSEAEQQSLASALQRTLEDSNEAAQGDHPSQ